MPYLNWMILAFILLLTGHSPGKDNRYRFWAGDIPPYSFVDAGQKSQGSLYQIFQTLVTRMGYDSKVEIVPWKRVLMETQKNSPILFIPAARSPDREKLYQWIEPLMIESFGIFTLPGREQDMQNKERVREARICTLRGSATEELVKRHQLSRLEVVATNDTCARLLKAGRVEAWLAARRAAFASYAQVGYDPAELRAGLVLEEWPLYLAASKAVPEADLQRWKQEIQKMKSDGTMERLLR
ncbi:MAG TPA: transporter substrate-binding domain-containing protein [Oligoflexus sp.]|uniref:substrate-binding periplasmic protein n=1 Tax=Oligoflexus sp. TaxID=1971216 RepID=UPI002D80D7C4|nr:transporter substrate-binding domain-containing protein [Oligoflexus sp.]HET9238594.1 transporter substrate-binding domain-containing protein [Oligoflexus sp.]